MQLAQSKISLFHYEAQHDPAGLLGDLKLLVSLAAKRGVEVGRVEHLLLCRGEASAVSFHTGEMLTLTREAWSTSVNSERFERSAKPNSSGASTQIFLDYIPGPQVFPTKGLILA